MTKNIRIQPRDIEIPADCPFKNDLLGREEPVKILTQLVQNIDGPCVLAVDAAWGAGKTTFVQMWAQHLRNQEIPVVEFNAWETDSSTDPFVALSSELMQGLTDQGAAEVKMRVDSLREAAKEVLRLTAPIAIRLAGAAMPVTGPQVGQELASLVEERLSNYPEEQKSVKEFRSVLQDAANKLSESRQNRPLVVFIDELDRCRPSYAIELLEVAKHLFAIDRIVFVLAVNRSELAHSIRGVYGSGFDANGYLRRFFDVDFRLPDPDRRAFIREVLRATQATPHIEGLGVSILQSFFGSADLSLRDIGQAMHRLGLMVASFAGTDITPTVVALILRTIHPDLYYRFIRAEASDVEVVDTVFDRPGAIDLRATHEGRLFEVCVISASFAIAEANARREDGPYRSALLQRYQELIKAGEQPDDPNLRHAKLVVDLVAASTTEFPGLRLGHEFRAAVQRLELLSSTLLEQPAQ